MYGVQIWRITLNGVLALVLAGGALAGAMQIEVDGLRYVRERDQTAVWFDARGAAAFATGSLSGALPLTKAELVLAKDDGRLPMEDHNTRIVVFGQDGAQARAVAEQIAKHAFHNVTFFDRPFDHLRELVGSQTIPAQAR
jgi:rhodanese-related sulfurtransferase